MQTDITGLTAMEARTIAENLINTKFKDIKEMIYSRIKKVAECGYFQTDFNTIKDFGTDETFNKLRERIVTDLKVKGFIIKFEELEYKTDYLVISWK